MRSRRVFEGGQWTCLSQMPTDRQWRNACTHGPSGPALARDGGRCMRASCPPLHKALSKCQCFTTVFCRYYMVASHSMIPVCELWMSVSVETMEPIQMIYTLPSIGKSLSSGLRTHDFPPFHRSRIEAEGAAACTFGNDCRVWRHCFSCVFTCPLTRFAFLIQASI